MNRRTKLSFIFIILIMMGATNAATKFDDTNPSKIITHAFLSGEVSDGVMVDVYRRTYDKNPQDVKEATSAIVQTFDIKTDPDIEFTVFDEVLKGKNGRTPVALENLYKKEPMKAKAIRKKMKILENLNVETRKQFAAKLDNALLNTSR